MKRMPQTFTQAVAERIATAALATWVVSAILGAILFAMAYGALETLFEGSRAKPARTLVRS